MPSNDNANQSGDRLDRFLIAGPAAGTPGDVTGIDAFLASPPLPAEPAPAAPAPTPQAVAAPLDPPKPADAPTIDPYQFPGDPIQSAGLPIIETFPPEPATSPAIADVFGDAGPTLIAPPIFDSPSGVDPTPGASLASDFAAGIEQGRGVDTLSALAANPLDEQMLADPSALLSAAPSSNPIAVAQPSSARFDPWASDTSAPPSSASFGGFGSSGLDSIPSGMGPNDTWARADDRSSTGSDALDRLESRLSRAVTQLEEAVSALSAAGPASLGSRPRGFKGRIDA